MEDYLHISIRLTILENLIGFKKFLMMELYVIYYGVIQIKDADIMLVHEEQDGHSVK
jgi:hypothetical protein